MFLRYFVFLYCLVFCACEFLDDLTAKESNLSENISCVTKSNTSSAKEATICFEYNVQDLNLRSILRQQCEQGDPRNQLQRGTFQINLCDLSQYKYTCQQLDASLDNGYTYKYNLYSNDNTIKTNCGLTSLDDDTKIRNNNTPVVTDNTTTTNSSNIPTISLSGTLDNPSNSLVLNTSKIDSLIANYEFFYTFTPSTTGSRTITLTPPSSADFDLFVYNNTLTSAVNCAITPTPAACVPVSKVETRSLSTENLTVNLVASTTYKIKVKRFSGSGSFSISVQ